MNVIALRGKSRSGKTPTLRIVYDILLANGYTQVPGQFRDLGSRDIYDVVEKNNMRVGIVTRGDYADVLTTDLVAFSNIGSHKAICACRTRGGTVQAVVIYPHQFIWKTIAASNALQLAINQNDANVIYNLI